jgi:shikimate dehydrogenase
LLRSAISGATRVAAVAGRPVAHSLSPAIHNAWIDASALDAVYVAASPTVEGFKAFLDGLRGGVINGLNITAPFKEQALAAADQASERASRAGAANLIVFPADGRIVADNTDGIGLLDAFALQAPGFDPAAGPVVICGAGGAARGATAAFLEAGAPSVVLLARSPERAAALVDLFGGKVQAASFGEAHRSLSRANAIVNATPVAIELPLETAPAEAVVMDMVYRPLRTPLLEQAAAHGLRTVDGLAMLIGQAAPSFTAFFGSSPPNIDVRAMVLAILEARG